MNHLAECYWPGVSAEKLAAAVERAERAAAQLRGQGRSLDFLGSILVPADEIAFWLFDGEEADVRAVSEKAGVPFERILESLRIGGVRPDDFAPRNRDCNTREHGEVVHD